jgi:hypothetical protein
MSDRERRCLLGDPDLALLLRIGLMGSVFLCLIGLILVMAAYLGGL